MRDGRNLCALFFSNLEDLHHEGDSVVLFEPFADSFGEHGRGKGPKRFPSFYLGVENSFHVRAPRIAEDRAVAKRARTPLHPPLEPAEDRTFGDRRSRAPAKFFLVTDFFDGTTRPCNLVAVLV